MVRITKVLGLRRPPPYVGKNSQIIPYFFLMPSLTVMMCFYWFHFSDFEHLCDYIYLHLSMSFVGANKEETEIKYAMDQ